MHGLTWARSGRAGPGLATSCRDVRELPAVVRGQMLDVIGHHAAECGIRRDETPNQLGRELDELAGVLVLDE